MSLEFIRVGLPKTALKSPTVKGRMIGYHQVSSGNVRRWCCYCGTAGYTSMTEIIRRIYARVDCLTPPLRRHLQWSARSSMKDHHQCHSGLLTHISTESTLHISSEVNPL